MECSNFGSRIAGQHCWESDHNVAYLWPSLSHDDVIKSTHFPRYWPFVRGIHRSPVNSLHKGQWRGALMFSLIYARINGWLNNREAGDLRRHRVHNDDIVIQMKQHKIAHKIKGMIRRFLIISMCPMSFQFWKHTSLFVRKTVWMISQVAKSTKPLLS